MRALVGTLVSEAISLLGTRITMIAIPLYVLATTGSAAKTGVVAFAEALPLVVGKVLVGPVIDRLGARPVAITCDLGSAVVVGAIPLLHDTGRLPFPVFVGLVAVAGALRGPGDAAKSAIIPAVVRHAAVPMERATGLFGTIERTASMVGAALGGLLIASAGAANALLVDAVSFAVSAAVFAWATTALRTETDAVPQSSYLRSLREGFAFLRTDRVLIGITAMVALTNLLDAAWSTVLVPVWAVDSGGGARVIGLLFATFGAAAALGALIASIWAERLPRYVVYLVAFLFAGAPRFIAMALDVPLVALLVVAVGAGFASGFINPVLGAVIYERIPQPLMGRVSSLTTAICWSLMPLGGLLGGLLASRVGISWALAAVGVAYFVVTMLPALDPRWRELDDRPHSVEEAHVAAA
ncbi:transmembrane secretion effector [Branchiibius hedensis]|uniref:Transmembrane secretion effector n=1 Tax=Branchiibius hedensis TaxID=672460 RepID=A0A2Y9C0T0_9MICO|nr:MFS transporter [Branchiibius hedensis]PWJ24246.1 transmembrane secretion effector [Branchiibius hedensis]SSA33063.1 Transmembrane secretion effector [Branchiibius hedensis]